MTAQKASLQSVWNRPDLPFTIGVRATPSNGDGVPDTMPFDLAVDTTSGVLVQRAGQDVRTALERAYAAGSLLGTAMDDTPLGRRYAEDFVAYLASLRPLAGLRVLEIGAGRGYLLRCLQDTGAKALGVEPGEANRPHWKRHGVNVIAKPFPCSEASGPFDLVVAYALLEHVEDLASFFSAIRAVLAPEGMLVVSVPDCTPYIAAGDPSMLLHEHFSYFTKDSLTRALGCHGWSAVDTRLAGYGGAIYAAARPHGSGAVPICTPADLSVAHAFGEKCRRLLRAVGERVQALEAAGRTLGVYCPARGLAILPARGAYRFFDDDPDLTGRFYPPFSSPVETRGGLLKRPVDELWILSRTFGPRLAAALEAELPATRIRLPDDLLATAASSEAGSGP